jgi:uncharacterized protein (DUF1810 family)
VEALLAAGRVPQIPGLKWANVAIEVHSNGVPARVMRFAIHAENGAPIDWNLPQVARMETAAKLTAFVAAQDAVYDQVRRELSSGRKETHWMWFIFPQMAGLGSSAMAQKFAIASAAEARSYLDHPVLGPRLRECTRLMLAVPGREISTILDYPDDLKFRSAMTLFATAAPTEAIFDEALQKFFDGQRDPATMRLISDAERSALRAAPTPPTPPA